VLPHVNGRIRRSGVVSPMAVTSTERPTTSCARENQGDFRPHEPAQGLKGATSSCALGMGTIKVGEGSRLFAAFPVRLKVSSSGA
jgi:hypothetical protein